MRYLLDANILISLTDDRHATHGRASAWFKGSGGMFATCPITQEALLRFWLGGKEGMTLARAKRILAQVEGGDGHEFWPDSVSYAEIPEAGVRGHKQITDAYLVALARHHRAKLATLDRALAAIHPDVAFLIP